MNLSIKESGFYAWIIGNIIVPGYLCKPLKNPWPYRLVAKSSVVPEISKWGTIYLSK